MALRTQAVVEAVAKGFDRLIRDMDEVGDKANEAGKQTQRGSNLASQGLKDWAIQTLSVTAAVGAAKVAARELYEAIGEGAELQLARQRFDALAGSVNTTGDALLGKMKAATGSMYSDAQLIQSATDIISTGLAGNERDVVRLATVVSELGIDMQQAILTFANNSKMRLDSLGLSVTDVEERTDELVAAGQDFNSAFDQAVLEGLEARLELVDSAAGTTAGNIKAMETAITDANDEFKMNLAGEFADELNLVAGSTKDTGGALTELAGLLGSALPGAIMRSFTPLQDLRTNLLITQQAMDFFAEGEFGKGQRANSKETKRFTNSLFEQDQALRDAIEASREATQQQQWFAEVSARAAERERNQADNAMRLEQIHRDLAPTIRASADANADWTEGLAGPMLEAVRSGVAESGNFNSVLFEQIQAVSDDATVIAAAGVATGEWSAAQAAAAIKAGLMSEKAGELAQAVKDGEMSVWQAVEALQAYQDEIDDTQGDYYVRFHFQTIGGPPQVTTGPGQSGIPIDAGATGAAQPPQFASGTNGWQRVPGGIGQPYPVTLHGGEMFNVSPKGQGAAAAGNTNIFYIQGREATALALSQAHVQRRQRANDYMGVS